MVMQLSHSEPAMAYAVVAVGAIHRARRVVPATSFRPEMDTVRHRFAMNQYTRAVSAIQRFIDDSRNHETTEVVEMVLLACLLFITFETLQCEHEMAKRHLRLGCGILSEHLGRSEQRPANRVVRLEAEPRRPMDFLSQIFVRLDWETTWLGDEHPYMQAICRDGNPGREASIPRAFRSLQEARMHLDALLNRTSSVQGALLKLAAEKFAKEVRRESQDEFQSWCLLHSYQRIVRLDEDEAVSRQLREVRDATAAWSSALASLAATHSANTDQIRLLLEIRFWAFWYMVSTLQDRDECSSDRFSKSFPHILDLAEKYINSLPRIEVVVHGERENEEGIRSFAMGQGILLPLYLVALKCRDQVVRRRALQLLRRVRVQEGMLDSDMLAICAAYAIVLEERSARECGGHEDDHVLKYEDVPESARFIDVTLAPLANDSRGCRLVCSKLGGSVALPFVLEEHELRAGAIATLS
ncbi:hypothetical protein CB0940_11910 [Cercospora beticola]|uniref:Transcription factor domain-containing protein n=2 Tax=Cercospora beticola TaxID=122368 RepID=A0A2G5IDW5_CERBT|nr:hypothetical protein CB0940_11910 [Cercospora beticola]PIB03046.1 hypothetical protein CB0940_11910 [Cercospora beticola]